MNREGQRNKGLRHLFEVGWNELCVRWQYTRSMLNIWQQLNL